MDSIEARMFRPVDGASLAVFRIAFGGLLLWDVLKFFLNDWIRQLYITPKFHFKYFGFEWVEPWAGAGMYLHFAVMGTLAFFIMIGLFYRVAAVLFLFAFTYVFLLDQTDYLNHFYFVILLNILLVFAPANRVYALDSLIWRKGGIDPQTVPGWSVWILRAQMEVMLIFAGIVKINPDWLQLQPLTMWLGQNADLPLIGQFLTETWAIATASYGSILLHIVGAPLLLFRRTRFVVFLLYVGFHLANHIFFNIGIFPWLTIAGTTIFFAPDWPRRFVALIASRLPPGGCRGHSRTTKNARRMTRVEISPRARTYRRIIMIALGLWVASQILIPMRHHLYPGDTSWTEQGHRFAWQMKLRDKRSTARFTVHDPDTGRTWVVNNRQFLSPRQIRKMASRPDMILQFAHHLAEKWRTDLGIANPEVNALVLSSLNGRPPEVLIDPSRNLAAIKRDLRPADWILPLTNKSL